MWKRKSTSYAAFSSHQKRLNWSGGKPWCWSLNIVSQLLKLHCHQRYVHENGRLGCVFVIYPIHIEIWTNFFDEVSNAVMPHYGWSVVEMFRMGGLLFNPLMHAVSAVITYSWHIDRNFYTIVTAAARHVFTLKTLRFVQRLLSYG